MTIPMDVPMTVQCMQFLYAVLTGFLIGCLYFILRAFGRRGSAFFWDAVFVTVSLTIGTVFFMTVCHGYPRVFHLLGFASGSFLVHTVLKCRERIRRSKRSTHEKEKVSHPA